MSVGCLLLVTALAVSALPAPAREEDAFQALSLIRPKQPTAAPDFTVPGLTSPSVKLGDFKGKVVFLNFWATWCVPCREEMPSMERLYRRYKDKGLAIVAISIDKNLPAVPPFVKQLGLTFPIGLDPGMEVASRYRVLVLPSSFLIDRAGKVVAIAVGARSWDGPEAQRVITTLLKAPNRSGGGRFMSRDELALAAQRPTPTGAPAGMAIDPLRVRNEREGVTW